MKKKKIFVFLLFSILSRVFFCDYLYEATGTQYYIARLHTVKKVTWREASIYMCNEHVYMLTAHSS